MLYVRLLESPNFKSHYLVLKDLLKNQHMLYNLAIAAWVLEWIYKKAFLSLFQSGFHTHSEAATIWNKVDLDLSNQ